MYFLGMCAGLYPFIKLVKIFLNLLKFVIPFALILFGIVDFGKAVIANKEDDMKKSQSIFLKRIIYAVAFFFVTTVVTLVMNMVSDSKPKDAAGNVLDVNSWYQCWDCTSKNQCKSYDVINDKSGGFYSKKNVSRDIDDDYKLVCSRDSSDEDYWCSVVKKGDNTNSGNNTNSGGNGNNSGINDCRDGQCLK